MTIFATLSPIDPGTNSRVTVRLCASQDEASTGAVGEIWWPAMITQPVIQARFFDGDFSSAVDAPSASFDVRLDVLIASGQFPRVQRYDWAGAECRLQRLSGGSLVDVALMLVDSFASEDMALGLRLVAARDLFDADVLRSTYAGTTGAEGGADLKGQLKPWVFGRALNVEPVFIDQIDNVFQVSGYGAVQAISTVYERGSSFGASVGNFANYAALVAANIPEGRWGTCHAQGMFRLGAPPAGVITCDVDGDNVGGFLRRTGAILSQIATRIGLVDKVTSSSMTALDTAVARNVNIVIREQTSFMELAQRMLAPCNAVGSVSPAGRLIASRVSFGSEQFTLDAQGREMPPVLGMARQNTQPPYKRIQMGGARSWRVHTFDEIAFFADLIDRGLYAGAEVYREGNIVDSADKSRWLYVNPTASSGNAPPTWPTASNSYWQNIAPPLAPSAIGIEAGATRNVPRGTYAAGTTYVLGDSVIFSGSSYQLIVASSTGNAPPDVSRWALLANAGSGPAGADGLPGLTVIVSNEAHVVATAADGSGGDYTGAGGQMRVLRGETVLTPAFSIAAKTPNTSWISIDSSGNYTVTDPGVDLATATLRAANVGVNYDRTYTLARSKQGVTGPRLALVTDNQAFTFTDGAANPGSQTITLTALLNNLSGTATWSTTPSVTLGGSGNTRTLTVANFGSNRQVTVEATLGGITDRITIVRTDRATGALAAENSINAGGPLFIGTLPVAKADAGLINANVPLGSNAVVNSDFTRGKFGWRWRGGSNEVDWGVNLTGYFGQRNVMWANVPGTLAVGDVADLYPNTLWNGGSIANAPLFAMPVVQGDRLAATVLAAPHRCTFQLYMLFFDGAGAWIAYAPSASGGTPGGATNGDPANFGLLTVVDTAPANARWAIPMMRMLGTGETSPFIFFTEPMLSKIAAGQTTAPRYIPGRADPNADVTSANTAAAITGQGALATKSNVDLATAEVLNKSLANVDSTANTKLGGIAAGATVGAIAGTNVFRSDGSTVLSQAEIRTAEGTAAAIAGQGALATRNNVGSAQIAASFGANLLPSSNPAWAPPQTFFVAGWNPDGVAGIDPYRYAQNGSMGYEWSLDPGQTSWAIYQPNASRGANVYGFSHYYFRWLADPNDLNNHATVIPVVEGQRVEFSVYVGNHRSSTSEVALFFFDSAGNGIGNGNGYQSNTATRFEGQGGNNITGYKRVFARTTAPAGAVSVLPYVSKGHTETGSDSWLFLVNPMLCIVPAGQEELTPWAPPGNYGYNLYANGQTVNQLRPAEFGANVTESRTAAAIAGQGTLATANSAAWGSQITGRPAFTTDVVNVDGADRLNSWYVRNPNDGSYLTNRWAAELGANVTESRTAAAISGQGDLATRNSATLPFGFGNLAVNSDFVNGLLGWSAAWDGNQGGTVNRGINLSGYSGQINVLAAWRPGSPTAGTVFDAFSTDAPGGMDGYRRFAIPVLPGERLCFSWLLGTHRCSGYAILGFYNGAGNYIEEHGGNTIAENFGAADGNPGGMGRSEGFATAPANARYARVWARAIVSGAADPFLFCAQPFVTKVPTSQTAVPAYSSGPTDRAADVTAEAQRSIEPQFPSIEVKQGEAGHTGNRTVTHVAKRSTATLSGGTWSLPSSNLGAGSASINSGTGTVTLSGIVQSGAYAVRYTHSDGLATDLAVNVTYVPTPPSGGGGGAKAGATTSNTGVGNNNNWNQVISLTITGAPNPGRVYLSDFECFLSVSSGTGTCEHEARLLVNGTVVRNEGPQQTMSGGATTFIDFSSLFIGGVYAVSGTNTTVSVEMRRTLGTGTISQMSNSLGAQVIAT
jgi:hypothetical protein